MTDDVYEFIDSLVTSDLTRGEIHRRLLEKFESQRHVRSLMNQYLIKKYDIR